MPVCLILVYFSPLPLEAVAHFTDDYFIISYQFYRNNVIAGHKITACFCMFWQHHCHDLGKYVKWSQCYSLDNLDWFFYQICILSEKIPVKWSSAYWCFQIPEAYLKAVSIQCSWIFMPHSIGGASVLLCITQWSLYHIENMWQASKW